MVFAFEQSAGPRALRFVGIVRRGGVFGRRMGMHRMRHRSEIVGRERQQQFLRVLEMAVQDFGRHAGFGCDRGQRYRRRSVAHHHAARSRKDAQPLRTRVIERLGTVRGFRRHVGAAPIGPH